MDNPSRGVWTITEERRRIRSADDVRARVRRQRKEYREGLRRGNAALDFPSEQSQPAARAPDDALSDESWQTAVLEVLRGIPPDAFERLCQRLLRECGFTKVVQAVRGRGGSGEPTEA